MKLTNRKLKIGAHTVTVRFVEDIDNEGDFDRAENVIRIKTAHPYTQQVSTLFHEVLHVMNNELDHTILDSLAEQLTQFLLDNKLLR